MSDQGLQQHLKNQHWGPTVPAQRQSLEEIMGWLTTNEDSSKRTDSLFVYHIWVHKHQKTQWQYKGDGHTHPGMLE